MGIKIDTSIEGGFSSALFYLLKIDFLKIILLSELRFKYGIDLELYHLPTCKRFRTS